MAALAPPAGVDKAVWDILWSVPEPNPEEEKVKEALWDWFLKYIIEQLKKPTVKEMQAQAVALAAKFDFPLKYPDSFVALFRDERGISRASQVYVIPAGYELRSPAQVERDRLEARARMPAPYLAHLEGRRDSKAAWAAEVEEAMAVAKQRRKERSNEKARQRRLEKKRAEGGAGARAGEEEEGKKARRPSSSRSKRRKQKRDSESEGDDGDDAPRKSKRRRSSKKRSTSKGRQSAEADIEEEWDGDD